MPHESWDVSKYLRFERERTQPSVDLVVRIECHAPRRIMDLGCGPGNSTRILRGRWPEANLFGLDNAAEMIESAKRSDASIEWLLGDISAYESDEPFDVVFSNAAFQWVPHHAELLPRLLKLVAPQGVLAFQVPSATFATVRTLIHELSRDPRWESKLDGARQALTLHPPGFYYDVLSPHVAHIELWETEYLHVLLSHEAIIEWMSSTGLRPFMSALDADEQIEFRQLLLARIAAAYPLQADGKVLFAFRRTFAICTVA